jgi:hypothetical protein
MLERSPTPCSVRRRARSHRRDRRGQPFFLERLAADARELGDAWDPSSAPTTIRALLEARLDRCSPMWQGARRGVGAGLALRPGRGRTLLASEVDLVESCGKPSARG